MNIAIISPFNPLALSDLLDQTNVKDTKVSASSVHAIVRGLLKKGIQVTVYSSCVGSEDIIFRYSGHNINIYLVQVRKAYFGLKIYPKLRRLFAEHKEEYDVIHAQWTYVYPYSILPFTRSIPTFCSVRDWCPYLRTLSKTIKDKLQMIVNTYYFKKVMKNKNVVKIANSSYTYDRISSYLHECNIPIVPNSISSEFISKDEIIKSAVSPIYISICASLLEPRKNIPTLLRAFEKVVSIMPDAKLILVGQGQKKDFEYLKLPDNVINNIQFCGTLSHKEVIGKIDKSAILVHPALEETFGNIFLEAGARNLPSIGGYDSGAVPQVLDYGRAGCLCNVRDPHSLSQAMLYVVQNSEYYQLITHGIKQKLMNEYIDTKVCTKLVEMYQIAIDSRRR